MVRIVGFGLLGFGLCAPAGTLAAVVDRINGTTKRIAVMPDMQQQHFEQGLVVIASTAAELAAFQRYETERWGKVVREAKIEAQ